jgi:elongation factor G
MQNSGNGLINLAVMGHFQCGKTTLVEHIACSLGALKTCGKVETKNTLSDFEPEELSRASSLSTSLISITKNNLKFNIFDTPGDLNFEHEIITGLLASELALITISALEGIQVGTEYVLDLIEKYQIPAMVAVTKLDKENAKFDEIIQQLNKLSSYQFLQMGQPNNTGPDYKTFDLYLQQQKITNDNFIETLVSCDDETLEAYLNGEQIQNDQLAKILTSAIKSQTVIPVVGYAAISDNAADHIVDFIINYAPRFKELSKFFRDQTTLPQDNKVFLSIIKTISDQYSGKLSIGKVLSGTLMPDTLLINQRTGNEEKIHQLQSLKGKEHINIDSASTGDIVGLAKLSEARAGDVLHTKGASELKLAGFPIQRGISMTAIAPKDQHDDDKLMMALARLSEEDPALFVERVDETHQTVIYGNGELHIAVTIERLKRKFSVSVEQLPIIIPLRETITSKAQAEGKHKKQTGGHGQFGVAVIEIEPLERSKGFEFIDQIVGGAIPKQYIPAVEKGIREQMQAGVIWGFPVVDVKVTLLDGKYHPVDSSELSFKLAGALAFREAMAKASPVLLEPISKLTVTVPVASQGDVLADLNGRRGKVISTQSVKENKWQEIVALVPTSELLSYNAELKSLTASRGKAQFEFDHYDFLPSHLAEKVPKAHQKLE